MIDWNLLLSQIATVAFDILYFGAIIGTIVVQAQVVLNLFFYLVAEPLRSQDLHIGDKQKICCDNSRLGFTLMQMV